MPYCLLKELPKVLVSAVSRFLELNKRGIDPHMSLILGNLGYKYDNMVNLTPEEVDFIFPNTELMANLEQKGFTKQQVQSLVDQGKSFKEIIRNALNQK